MNRIGHNAERPSAATRSHTQRVQALACALLGAAALLAPDAFLADASAKVCKPKRPKPPIVLKTMGPCNFDPASLSFAGAPSEQAACLMRGMDRTRNLQRDPAVLPPAFAGRIGRPTELPSREALSGHLSRLDLEWDFAAHLWQPLSRARDNDPEAPMARYFVIHDTSGPNYGRRPFPADLDTRVKVNNLNNFKCSDGWEKAHAVINRSGQSLLSHEFSIPWRESKFERARNFDGALKGLFLHVELIQPRRQAPGLGRRNDAQTPNPPFTAAQYDRLALLYTIVSVRAGAWLVPAFHAAIDAHIRGGHDDPLGFDIGQFAAGLDRLLAALRPQDHRVASETERPDR